LVAIGDQVYWDLLAPENGPKMGASPAAERIAGTFDRSALVLGSDNETVLKRAVEPQLIPVYGTDFRSTPVFFMQDDHDYFDNDEPPDDVNFSAAVLFPPARPRHTKPFLSGVPARSRAPAGPAMVLGRRPLRRRVGNIRHRPLRAASRDFAVRHPAHPDPCRPERRLYRSRSR